MEELLGRQAPHSAPAEQAVIGAMLIDPSCIPDVIEKVKSDEFYIQANRDIFDTIFAMFSDALHEQFALTIEKQKIVQAEPIKSFGAYEVKCKLGYEVTGTIHVLVIEDK